MRGVSDAPGFSTHDFGLAGPNRLESWACSLPTEFGELKFLSPVDVTGFAEGVSCVRYLPDNFLHLSSKEVDLLARLIWIASRFAI